MVISVLFSMINGMPIKVRDLNTKQILKDEVWVPGTGTVADIKNKLNWM